jgi:hypothetical protein
MHQLKAKEEAEGTFQKSSTGFHKKIYLHKKHNPMTKVLGLHENKSFLHSKGEI